jgi:hypothetical protein
VTGHVDQTFRVPAEVECGDEDVRIGRDVKHLPPVLVAPILADLLEVVWLVA